MADHAYFLVIAMAVNGVISVQHVLHGGVLDPNEPCHMCPPGYGVTRMCEKETRQDTTCTECLEGTFSEMYSYDNHCLPCSQCPYMYYAMRPCSRIKDSVCLPCSDKNGGAAYGNEDYLFKCESQTTKKPEMSTRSTKPPEVPKPSTTTTTTTTTTVATTTLKSTTGYTTVQETALNSETKTKITFSPAIESTMNESNDTNAAYITAADTGSSWLLLGIMGGVVFVFVLAVIVVITLQKKKERKQRKFARGCDNPDLDDIDADPETKMLEPAEVPRPPDIVIEECPSDSKTPLCALPARPGPPSPGTTPSPQTTTGSPPTGPTPGTPRTSPSATPSPPPSPSRSGASGTPLPPEKEATTTSQASLKMTPQASPGTTPTPSQDPQKMEIQHQLDSTPEAPQEVQPKSILKQPQPSLAGSSALSEITATPKAVHRVEPQQNNIHHSPVSKSPKRKFFRKRIRKRDPQDAFNRSLQYMDENSGDEVVTHTGRPPSINYKDEFSQNRIKSFLKKLRGRSSRRSSTASKGDTSFDLDNSTVLADMSMDSSFDYNNKTMDITYDYLNESGMSFDFMNMTGVTQLNAQGLLTTVDENDTHV